MALRKVQSGVIADNAITSDKIAAGAVTASDIASSAISDKLGYTPANESSVNTQISGALVNPTFTGNSITVPAGTTAQRPGSPAVGMVRYNTDLGNLEQYTTAGWGSIAPPPSITSVSPTSYNGEQGTQFTINGAAFGGDVSVKFITTQGTEYVAATVVRVSATQLTATTPQDFSISNEPLAVKVIQGSGSAQTLGIIDCGGTPTWNTSAGTIATINDVGGSYSPIATLSASDPDAGATIAYSITSGALPGNVSLNSSTGAISGDPNNVDSQTTYNFTAAATDNAGNQTTRTFSIILNPVADGTTSARAAPSGTYLYDTFGYTTDGLYWIKPTAYSGSPIQCRVWFSNANYGRGAVLIASYASQGGWAQSDYTGGSNTSNLTNNNYFSSQNNSAPAVLPRDFINALVKDSTTNHTMGGFVCAMDGVTYFQTRDTTQNSKGTTGRDINMWRYMFATGEANNNLQMRNSGRLGVNWNPSEQISGSFSLGGWYTYTGGRGSNDGGNNHHYMPDDETGGGEWWFRENIDDSCHQAYGRAGNDLAFVW